MQTETANDIYKQFTGLTHFAISVGDEEGKKTDAYPVRTGIDRRTAMDGRWIF